MRVVWMIRAEQATWHSGHPEYYRIIWENDELQGQFYNPTQKTWTNSSKGMGTIKWLFVESDILVTEVGNYDNLGE